jgi:ABC-type uncharacterized transport system permease subunit
MPQWIANFFSPDSRAPLIVAIFVGLIVALLILFFLYRLVFGHRLRLPGSTASVSWCWFGATASNTS